MASIPGSHYEIFAPGQTVNFGLTYDANSFAPPVPGEFNLEVIINATGTGNYPTPPGYQGVLIESVPGKTIPPTVTMLHGDYGLIDAGGNDRIFLGDGSESVQGASGDTLAGGTGLNQFLDAHFGNQSAPAGSGSIWAGGGNSTMFGGAHDTVQGVSGGSASIGFAGGNETFWDDGATAGRHDSISTFSQAGGDRVSLNSLTDTPAGVAGTAVTDGSGNTTVTLHDGSTITFIGISTINNTFFTTH